MQGENLGGVMGDPEKQLVVYPDSTEYSRAEYQMTIAPGSTVQAEIPSSWPRRMLLGIAQPEEHSALAGLSDEDCIEIRAEYELGHNTWPDVDTGARMSPRLTGTIHGQNGSATTSRRSARLNTTAGGLPNTPKTS